MGNESSVEMNEDVELQAQGDENLWSIHLQRGLDGEEEDTCIFSRILGEGSPADQWQFRAAIEVIEQQGNTVVGRSGEYRGKYCLLCGVSISSVVDVIRTSLSQFYSYNNTSFTLLASACSETSKYYQVPWL